MKMDDFNELKELKKELQMWQEYQRYLLNKSLNKSKTDRIAISFSETEEKVSDIMCQLQKKVNECINFISKVEKSDIRQAMFYKFVEGKNYVQIAFMLDTTEDAISKKVRRYLKKCGAI